MLFQKSLAGDEEKMSDGSANRNDEDGGGPRPAFRLSMRPLPRMRIAIEMKKKDIAARRGKSASPAQVHANLTAVAAQPK